MVWVLTSSPAAVHADQVEEPAEAGSDDDQGAAEGAAAAAAGLGGGGGGLEVGIGGVLDEAVADPDLCGGRGVDGGGGGRRGDELGEAGVSAVT